MDLPVKTMLFPVATALPPPSADMAGRVAIVMRTKDRPLLLHRALSSVLCQSCPDWHLYLVNDGGDRTRLEELLAGYRPALDERLTVIHHPASLGMENASDAALALAREEFAVVHDDDDSWHPEFLEATTEFLGAPGNENFVAVTTGCVVLKERIVEGRVETIGREPWVLNRGPVDFGAMLRTNAFPPICMLFRRAAVDQIGPFNGALPVLGDWEFNIRLMTLGDIDFIDRSLAYYHHRQGTGGNTYGNSVVDGESRHRRYRVLLGNSILRTALQQQPGSLGSIQALISCCSSEEVIQKFSESMRIIPDSARRIADIDVKLGRIADIDVKLGRIASKVDQIYIVSVWGHKMLRPIYWFWKRSYPLRRMIAKLRGRP